MLRLVMLTRTRTEVRFGHPDTDQVVVMPVNEWNGYGSPHTIIVVKKGVTP